MINGTVAEFNKFYDDSSTYTGVHKQGIYTIFYIVYIYIYICV